MTVDGDGEIAASTPKHTADEILANAARDGSEVLTTHIWDKAATPGPPPHIVQRVRATISWPQQ